MAPNIIVTIILRATDDVVNRIGNTNDDNI